MLLKVLKTDFLQVPIVYCSWIDYEMEKCCFDENTDVITFNDFIVPVLKYFRKMKLKIISQAPAQRIHLNCEQRLLETKGDTSLIFQ